MNKKLRNTVRRLFPSLLRRGMAAAGRFCVEQRMRRFFVLLAAIAGLSWSVAAVPTSQAQTPAAIAAAGVPADRSLPDYRLGSGDKVRVITFGEESLTGEFFVSASGKISIPLVGEVQAGGLTALEFQREIETTLKNGYLREPRVSVEVLNYRPFYILGEVKKPGEYPYTNGLTVLNAVATAEGFTYRANTKKVFIRHANTKVEQEAALQATTIVAPGDTIRIVERFF
jgi:polysaccharide export outer membrane protein